jgi:transcriptional regulator
VKAVPTWNYTAVHVYGAARIVDDPAAVYASQKRLVDFYEAGADTPWRMEDVDADYIDGMLRAIVSFEISVDRLEGKFKLSQNRTAEDRTSVIEALSESPTEGGKKIAGLMACRETGLPG